MEALFVLIPVRVVEETIQKVFHDKTGLEITMASFNKVFPFAFEAKGARFSEAGKSTGFDVARIRASFSPLSLLRLRLGLVMSGDIYGGRFEGSVGRGPGAFYARINIKDAVAPALGYLGGVEPGKIDLLFDITAQRGRGCPEGIIKAKGRDGRIRAFTLMGVGLSAEKISAESLEVRLSNCKAFIKVARIKTLDFSARASGVIGMAMDSPPRSWPIDIRIEAMPASGLMEVLNKLVFLSPYRRSPAYYSAVIKGTPSSPKIMSQ